MFFYKLIINLRIKFGNLIFNSFPSLKKFDEIKFITAQSYFNIIRKSYGNIKNFNEIYFKVFSQNGEDGIIDFLIEKIKIEDLKFV